MSTPRSTSKGAVLISGASIAGPALAYWLVRGGYAVTVVEKSSAPRGGGYPIDIRGTALEVVRRMGLLEELRDAQVNIERFTFLEDDGAQVASLAASPPPPGPGHADLEVGRGDLTAALYESVREDVEFLFDDSIETLAQTPEAVEVTLRSGARRSVDAVIGADGMHSRTRRLVFGEEERFHRHLGYAFGLFSMPDTVGLGHELVMWNDPGRAAALYATGGAGDPLHAFLTFHHPSSPRGSLRDPARRRSLIEETYRGAGWRVPEIVEALGEAEDLFFDTVGQIRMPSWSRGRVGLVGDAAYAPSFLTGQGTSLALVGAYMLASALVEQPEDPAASLTAYERSMREFVTANQDLVDTAGAPLFPVTAEDLELRNSALRGATTMPPPTSTAAHSGLTLPAERRAGVGAAPARR